MQIRSETTQEPMKTFETLPTTMPESSGATSAEIPWRGRTATVPAVQVDDKTIVVLGHWIKIACVHDEEWLEGRVKEPDRLVKGFTEKGLKADIFTFSQRLPDVEPQFPYQFEWDNVAAIPIASFDDWWLNRLPQVSRKNVRRSAKRGVVVRAVTFDDQLVRGIMEIQNETRIRQGTPNVHHGKDFATVKREYSSFLDRCEFFGAYHKDELIGIIKLVQMGRLASILNILCMTKHYDKRPANALIAKVVEACCARHLSYVIYGRYVYGNKTDDPLTEFKHRNGFSKVAVPRYYIPLTIWGKIVIKLRLHRGAIGVLPAWLIKILISARSKLYRLLLRPAVERPTQESRHAAVEGGQ